MSDHPSDELFLNLPFADSKPIERRSIEEKGLRIYHSAPGTLTVQIRTATGKEGRISHVLLNRDLALTVARRLLRFAEHGE